MKKNIVHLGKLIEEEVRRQNLSIVDFAKMICCTRNNVYNIFERCTMDVSQLQLISKVLHRNFFMEILENPELVDPENPLIMEQLENKRAVAQFMEVVPKVLEKLDKQPIISFGRPAGLEPDIEIPDFMVTMEDITLTIGDYISDKTNMRKNPLHTVDTFTSPDGSLRVDRIGTNNVRNYLYDIKLDYKTEEEWEKILRFIFDIKEKGKHD